MRDSHSHHPAPNRCPPHRLPPARSASPRHGPASLRAWLLACVGLLLCTGRCMAATVEIIELQGAVSPVLAAYVADGLDHAARHGAELVVLRIDTPGGLDSATRTIVKAIIASPVPVAAYVAPGGARAASAGTFILYASHIAAMAPGTNVGAATPVALGAADKPDQPSGASRADTGHTKAVNDAVAYLRALALLRARNADWAEHAVRDAASLEAETALREQVIDVLAQDLPDLLQQLDGRKLTLAAGERRLRLAGASVHTRPQGWRVRVLSVLSEPEVALMLVMLGLAGLFIELTHPGLVLPGIAGAIALLLGMYALQLLPLDLAAVALLALGIALLAAEVVVPSGLLGAGGTVALALAALMMGDAAQGGSVPRGVALAVIVAIAVGMVMLAGVVRQGRRRPSVSGDAALTGVEGVIVDATPGNTWALLQGEHWRVVCRDPLAAGQRVRVLTRDGLTLRVAAGQRDNGDKP